MLSLPIELVDSIIDFVDDRSDILSLTLVCRFLAERLIPSVLDYREITTFVQPEGLWTQLAQNPSLAQNVRALHIEATGKYWLLPRAFRYRDGEASLDDANLFSGDHTLLIIPALRNMTKLISFDCDWFPGIVAPRGYNPILEVLHERCPRLRGLQIHDRSSSDDETLLLDQRTTQVEDNALWEKEALHRLGILSNIRNIASFRYKLYQPSDLPNITPIPFIVNFMSNNSALRILHLEFREACISQYEKLAHIHFPHLHTMKLSALEFPSMTLLPFLHGNPTIEILDICVESAPDSPTTEVLEGLREGSLPNLHTFVAFTVRSWICICHARPPLTQLEDIYVHEWDESDAEQTAALLAVSHTLEKVVAIQADICFGSDYNLGKWFLENLPHVQLEIIGEWD